MIVFADWPGHGPREVEDQVTYPLALELQGLRGVRSVRSSSDFHYSLIHVILDESVDRGRGAPTGPRAAGPGRGGPPAGRDPAARAGLARRRARSTGTPSRGRGSTPAGCGRSRTGTSGRRLASVAGVAEVASVGGFPVEYQVSVVPDRLQARGVTLEEVLAAIARSNATVGGHSIQKGNAEYVVRGVGRLGASAGGGDAVLGDRPRPRRGPGAGAGRAGRAGGRRGDASPSARGLAGGSWRRTAARRSAAWS